MKKLIEVLTIIGVIIFLIYKFPQEVGTGLAVVFILYIFTNITDGLSRAAAKYKKVK